MAQNTNQGTELEGFIVFWVVSLPENLRMPEVTRGPNRAVHSMREA